MTGLVLESSTTSAKAMIYDPETGRVEVRTAPFVFTNGDAAMQDAESVFEQTAALGRQVCEGRRVDVISLSGTWHSVMLLDRGLSPVTPVYQWPYTGAEALCAELRRDVALTNWFYRRTGCMVSAIYPAFKLMRLAKQGYDLPGIMRRGRGLQLYRLTAVCGDGVHGPGTGFLNTIPEL